MFNIDINMNLYQWVSKEILSFAISKRKFYCQTLEKGFSSLMHVLRYIKSEFCQILITSVYTILLEV